MGAAPDHEKLKSLKEPLRAWNKDVFGDIENNVNKLQKELLALDNKAANDGLDTVDVARQSYSCPHIFVVETQGSILVPSIQIQDSERKGSKHNIFR